MDLSNKLNPEELESQEYKFGWTTDIESESAPPGLNEEVIRWISSKKSEPEWLLDWRLKAFKHFEDLLAQERHPEWAGVHYPSIDYQDIIYWSAPKAKAELESLDQVDQEILDTFEKLGLSLIHI